MSKTGAKGLVQIKDFNFDMLSIKDPFSIQENVSGLTQYLLKNSDKWQSQIDNGPQSVNHRFSRISIGEGSIIIGVIL